MKILENIVSHFDTAGTPDKIEPLGNGLINDTFSVTTIPSEATNYVLQRINHHVFTDVEGLQRNILAVTRHIRRKLTAKGETDIDRKVLTLVNLRDSDKTYYFDGENYWRMLVFIPDAYTFDTVNPHYAYRAGIAFGNFQAMLTDIPDTLTETIPDFHNMEHRLNQFRQAIKEDIAGRVSGTRPIIDDLLKRADDMCIAERLYRDGQLPKRICHCDTKVNNMMFDADGSVLCVIDLDTVMPSFIFSDYGDFLRTGANTAAEDEPDTSRIHFDMDIFRAFTDGYLSEASAFLTRKEIELLPYAAALFPYQQGMRFMTDYLNGDKYFKIKYPEHNLVRTRAQIKLLESVESSMPQMHEFIAERIVQSQENEQNRC